MIEKVIVRRALKADRFYLPGEVLFPPFSPSIMAEIRTGRGILDIYSVSDQKDKAVKEIEEHSIIPPVQAIDQADKSREILFRKFEQLEIPNRIIYKPPPQRGTSPPWFMGRYAPKKRKLLHRQFEKLKESEQEKKSSEQRTVSRKQEEEKKAVEKVSGKRKAVSRKKKKVSSKQKAVSRKK